MKSHARTPSAPPSARGKWSKVAVRDRCARMHHPLIHGVSERHYCWCGKRQLDSTEKPERGECPTCDEEQDK
jgi:hypothetical protein